MQNLSSLGPLRIALYIFTLILVVTAFFADGEIHMHDWRLVPNVIAPSLAMMIFFVFPLDITMSLVFRSSAESPEERQRLTRAIKLDCLMYGLLIAAWLPFMLKVLDIELF